MAITFDPVTQFNKNCIFEKLIITFRKIYHLSGFEEVQIFPFF